MKEGKILSTAGLGLSDSNRLKTYCSLMHESLVDDWVVVDDFIESHVCFIHSDFLANLGGTFKAKSQVTVLVTKNKDTDSTFDYQINLPFTTNNVRKILNDISNNYEFSLIGEQQNSNDTKSSNFKFLLNFKKSLFGEKNKINLNKPINNKASKVITERLTMEAPETCQILFIGSPRSGKSKAIESICGDSSLSTNLYVSDEVSVRIDYGEYKLDNNNIKLIGLPSKIRSDASWNILSQQASTIVILLDLSRPEPLTYLEYYLNFLNTKENKLNTYCCFTHCDKYKASLHRLVLAIKEKFPEFTGIHHIDARQKQDVEKLLNKVLKK